MYRAVMVEQGEMSVQERKLAALVHYCGQRPLRADRVALAVICWQSDFGAYAKLGASITGSRYIKAGVPGEPPAPRTLREAVRNGWRWGAVRHQLETGRLTYANALWVAEQWSNGVPI